MSMVDLRRIEVPIFEPLLQLACMTDLVWSELSAFIPKLFPKIAVDCKNFSAANCPIKQVTQNFFVDRGTVDDTAAEGMFVLRRERRIGHEPVMLGLFHQGIEEKLRSAFHH